MATHSLQPLHHHHHSLRRRRSFSSSAAPSSYLLKLITTTTTSSSKRPSLSTTATFALSPSSSSSSSSATSPSAVSSGDTSLDHLKHLLSAKDYREADEETRRLIIALAGDAAVKRGYVFFSEVQFIPESALRTIDELWRENSDGKFGYSVQKKIWKKSKKDFSQFFIRVGWMKKLGTEIEQYNYRAFPNEFIWELQNDTPQGHLPLTNALRGTQLLNCLLNHPAFKDEDEEDEEEEEDGDSNNGDKNAAAGKLPFSKKKVFTADYGF